MFALWTYDSLVGWDTLAGISNPSGLFNLTGHGITTANAIIYADNVSGGPGTIWLTGIQSTPEPSTLALGLLGLASLLLSSRRRSIKKLSA